MGYCNEQPLPPTQNILTGGSLELYGKHVQAERGSGEGLSPLLATKTEQDDGKTGSGKECLNTCRG